MGFKAMHALVLPRQGAKLQKCVWRWGHLTWPGDLTFTCMGSKFYGNVRNECGNRHTKFGGTARRRFYAIWKKTQGGGRISAPPPVGAPRQTDNTCAEPCDFLFWLSPVPASQESEKRSGLQPKAKNIYVHIQPSIFTESRKINSYTFG